MTVDEQGTAYITDVGFTGPHDSIIGVERENALGRFLSKIPDSPKVGVIAGVGDRRDEDTVNLGRLSAQMFDEIIIRHDRDMRGRSKENMNDLLFSTGVDPMNIDCAALHKIEALGRFALTEEVFVFVECF